MRSPDAPFDELEGGPFGRDGAWKKPIGTCLILAMPWTAYSLFTTICSDVQESYLSSMGISTDVPRFLPPIVSFILGPILGSASDRSLSKWGRRNVFLVAGMAILTVSAMLFGSAEMLFSSHANWIRLLFLLVNVGALLLNIGLRARLMDEVPMEFQVHAQAAVALWGGVGGVLGPLFFSNTAVVAFASEISGQDILVSFSAAIAGILATTIACLYLRPEHPQDPPTFQPPLGRLVREAWRQIVFAPMLFRMLCIVYFVLYFAWSSFKNEIYVWWGSNVYMGCKDDGCNAAGEALYKQGLSKANSALMVQNGLQVFFCLVCLLFSPQMLNTTNLKRASVGGLVLGTCALVVAVSVGKFYIPVAYAAFVVTASYQTVVSIFPYSVVGIMGKHIQESAHGFNNNGLYIGVLTLFAAASEFTVQIYGTENMAPLGSGNVLALPCILFAVGVGCTAAFSVAETAWAAPRPFPWPRPRTERLCDIIT